LLRSIDALRQLVYVVAGTTDRGTGIQQVFGIDLVLSPWVCREAKTMSTATMEAVRPQAEDTARRAQGEISLAVADVGCPPTENLYREIVRDSVSVLMLKCMDYVNGWRRGLHPWSPVCRMRQSGPELWEQQFVLPTGWMKRYPRMGMRPIARSIRSWWEDRAPELRGLVMLYPHYLYLRDQLQPDVSIYYNIDDYALYWPKQAERIHELERELVRSSDWTVCVARIRAEELKAAVPEAADRIHHIPWGSPTPFLAANPLVRPADGPEDIAHLPRPLLGYIGSLEDRVDWDLMATLSDEFPEASIVVVGQPRSRVNEPWWEACARFLARPNVHAIGFRPQGALPRYYQAFDVTLIPYLTDHPFNVACSPTKIMDAMGSGRPIVATALPECRLHSQRFHVAEDAGAFLDAVRQILDLGSDDGRAAIRHAYAVANTCAGVGDRILELVDGRVGGERTLARPIAVR
jgi:teichuronic acid biosynthesis glycosyltransferase TuaH